MEAIDTSHIIDELNDKFFQDPKSVSICNNDLNIGDFILMRCQSARQTRKVVYAEKI